ncbi:MAG: hypothetical protein KDA94_04825 [Acidimicrobiales bacterium]|nr:hypothetical protein [Acidimicrobiales bacterium]
MSDASPTTPMDPRSGGRNHPNSHEASSAPIRMGFFEPLGDWLAERRAGARHDRILDFGCGDLLLAVLLDGTWIVDGYDESPTARAAARESQTRLRAPGTVHDRLADVPTVHVRAVVVNSLFQYIPGPDAARDLFATVGSLLAPDATIGIVVTDAVSEGANRAIDLIDVVSYNLSRCGVRDALVGTVKGIRSGRPSTRHRIPQAELERAAAEVGLHLERLPTSLTRFRRRATYVLRHAAPDGERSA